MSRPDPTNYTTPIRIIQLEPILRSLFYFIYLIVRGRVSSAVRCTSSAPFHSQGTIHHFQPRRVVILGYDNNNKSIFVSPSQSWKFGSPVIVYRDT